MNWSPVTLSVSLSDSCSSIWGGGEKKSHGGGDAIFISLKRLWASETGLRRSSAPATVEGWDEAEYRLVEASKFRKAIDKLYVPQCERECQCLSFYGLNYYFFSNIWLTICSWAQSWRCRRSPLQCSVTHRPAGLTGAQWGGDLDKGVNEATASPEAVSLITWTSLSLWRMG